MHDNFDCEDRCVAPQRADRTSQDVELVSLGVPVCEPKPLVSPLRREELVHGPHVELLASVVVLDDIEHSNAVTSALSNRAFARGARCDRDLLASVPTLGCRNVQCLLGSAKPAQERPDIGVATAELLPQSSFSEAMLRCSGSSPWTVRVGIIEANAHVSCPWFAPASITLPSGTRPSSAMLRISSLSIR